MSFAPAPVPRMSRARAGRSATIVSWRTLSLFPIVVMALARFRALTLATFGPRRPQPPRRRPSPLFGRVELLPWVLHERDAVELHVREMAVLLLDPPDIEIGRASCRERV